jgi:hypothetical protein
MTAVMHARHRFLPDIAALCKADRALFEPELAREVFVAHVEADSRPSAFDPHDLGDVRGDGIDGLVDELLDPCPVTAVEDQIQSLVGCHGHRLRAA